MNTQIGVLSLMVGIALLGPSNFGPAASPWVEAIHLDISGSISSPNPSPSPPPPPDASTSDPATAYPATTTTTTAKPEKHLPTLPPRIDPSPMIDHIMHQLEPASVADGLAKMGQQLRERLKKFIDRFIPPAQQQRQQHASLVAPVPPGAPAGH